MRVSGQAEAMPDVFELLGEADDDVLNARRYGGDLILEGGVGNDVLIGGLAQTELWGGEGVDTFQLRNRQGMQRIMDFDPDEDQLDLRIETQSLLVEAEGDDLWLLQGDRPVAIFEGLAQQEDAITELIG